MFYITRQYSNFFIYKNIGEYQHFLQFIYQNSCGLIPRKQSLVLTVEAGKFGERCGVEEMNPWETENATFVGLYSYLGSGGARQKVEIVGHLYFALGCTFHIGNLAGKEKGISVEENTHNCILNDASR